MKDKKIKMSIFYDHIISGAYQKDISTEETAPNARQLEKVLSAQ